MKVVIARFLVPSATLLAGVSYIVHPEARQAGEHPPLQYHVTELASLGGTVSRGNGISNRGWVTGYSNLPGNQSRHAMLWVGGEHLDLGTLGGFNSNVPWPVKDNVGIIAGISQTATPDPLGETWSCRAFFPAAHATGYTCLGFVWEDGVMRALPTLGGNNGFATGVNNRRQIVGWAENAVHDPTCVAPQVLQFHAVVWGPGRDQIEDLLPLPGDTSGAATAINNKGQVVGISGTCDQAVGRFTAAHAVIWHRGTITDIGNLGGNTWNTPMAINERGDVVGFASQAGDDPDNPNLLAFIWTKQDGIRALDLLPGDVTNQANGINARGQVVGTSCDIDGNCRAFLWQHGVMMDLNTLIAPGYTNQLESAQDINDQGVITGRTVNPATNERRAYIATPFRSHE